MASKSESNAAAATPPPVEAPTTMTKWSAFEKAGLMITEIECNGYRPFHRFDASCHTRLVPKADSLLSHVENHGGGFRMVLKQLNGKVWPGWKRFVELGIEARDFRCDNCDKVLPFNPMHILEHMKPHKGKVRRILPGGTFNITLTLNKPPVDETAAFEDFEEGIAG